MEVFDQVKITVHCNISLRNLFVIWNIIAFIPIIDQGETERQQDAGETEAELPEQNQEWDQLLRHPGKWLGLEEGGKEGETWETSLLFRS